jgi:hydroxymethylglutaryl-CoA synthase
MHLVDARRKYARKSKQMELEEKKSDSFDEPNTSPLPQSAETPTLPEEYLTKPIEETYSDRALEGTLKSISSASYKQRLSDSNAASKLVGNTYTASVFLGIASLIDGAGKRGELTPGKTVVVFSYGSGALATMYRLHVRDPTEGGGKRVFTIQEMVKNLSLSERLASREEVHPSELDLALETRARMHRSGAPYSPVYPTIGRMFPGMCCCL